MSLTLNDLDWLEDVNGEGPLHHAKLTDLQARDLEWDARCYDVTFDCGDAADIACIPGPFTRMGERRCDRCSDANGFPRGVGSPKNDPECRAILGI